MINIADLIDPNDERGRTYRQVNAARVHAIAIGTLVELESGARLFVVHLSRDCDQTPLYSLAASSDETDRYRWLPGYDEESLDVVDTHAD